MDEKIIGLDKNKDIDRRLEETTKQLQREREKLMAVIRMSGSQLLNSSVSSFCNFCTQASASFF